MLPAQETAAVALDGKVYVLGGMRRDARVIDAVEIYDVATCSWSSGPPLPRPIHHANAAVIGDTIFVAGALETPDFVELGDTWAWRPGDATWSPRAKLPAGQGAAVTGVLDGKLYVAGGLRAPGAVVDVAIYDPVADTWSRGPDLPMPRDHGCGGVIGGTLYVAGGRRTEVGLVMASLLALAPGGSWMVRASMPTARGGIGCGVVGDRLIVVGGEGNPNSPTGVFAQAEAYDPVTDSWQSLAPMPTPRHGMAAAAWNGKLYVPGGAIHAGFGTVGAHEVFTP